MTANILDNNIGTEQAHNLAPVLKEHATLKSKMAALASVSLGKLPARLVNPVDKELRDWKAAL